MSRGSGKKARPRRVPSPGMRRIPSGKDFVRDAMRRLDCRTAKDLVIRMHWDPDRIRLVARWLAGETEPNYRSTMELLQAAGMLREETVTPLTETQAARRDKLLEDARDLLRRLEEEAEQPE